MPDNKPITEIAQSLIKGDRAKDYGDMLTSFTRIAALWSVVLGVPVSAEQVALCMLQLKVARAINTPTHRDTLVDICGYATCLDMINEARSKGASHGE